MSLITGALDYAEFRNVDMVIEVSACYQLFYSVVVDYAEFRHVDMVVEGSTCY